MPDLLPPSSPAEQGAANPKPMATSSTQQTQSPDPASRRSAWGFAQSQGVTRAMLFAGVAIAIAVAAVAWLDARRTEQALRTEVAQRLADVDASTHAATRTQSQLAAELRDAQAKITLIETRLAESQAQQAALDALYRDLAPSRDEIALTEIEQVLLIASQQLQLAGNVQSALAALQLAEAKLQRLDRPQFLSLRRALTRDIDRLKATPFVDVDGMSLKLDQAMAMVNTLPLAIDERLPPPQPKEPVAPARESQWQRFLREAWSDIRQLVRIEVSDRPLAPVLAPPQQYFLRENLKLRLLSARIALLNRDGATFKADIAAADTWLKQYFDTRAKPVQTMQATMKQLAAAPMSGETPDLAASLEAMRALRLAQDRGSARFNERAAVAGKEAAGVSARGAR